MADQELVKYIRNQLNAGHSPEEVRTHLVGYGHPIREVEDAMDSVLGPPARPPAPGQAQQAPPAGPAKTIQPPAPSGVWEISIFKLLKNWFMSLGLPGRAFRELKEQASFSGGFKNILIAGLIGGFIAGFMVYVKKGDAFDIISFPSALSTVIASIPGYSLLSGGGNASKFLVRLGSVMFIPLFSWLFLSSFTYMFAMFTGGRGSFKTHSYFVSLYIAPLSIIMVLILGAVGNSCALFIIPTIISFYAIYPLTFAIKEAHDTDTLRAVLAWLIPLIIFLLLFVMDWDAVTGYMKTVC